MIPLTCSHCGSKLKVKNEYAGRRGSCPTCKKPVVVPSAAPAAAAIPTGRIQGARSSLQQAGIEVGVTLDAPRSADSRSASQSVASLLAGQARHGSRYTIEGEIARGGMGAVVRAVDGDIRREYTTTFNDLTLLKTMPLKTLDLSICPISDLTALQGHKLTSLQMFRCHQIKDLSPLANLPLRYLNMSDCSQLTDLSGLRGMQLETIWLTPNFIKTGTDALREMKSLKAIAYAYKKSQKSLAPAEFWQRFDAGEFNQ